MNEPSDLVSADPNGKKPPVADPPSPDQHERIGRYRVERLLGQGGYGIVYLAHDDHLSRHVAIKVPHARLVTQLGDAEAYLTEARTVANLDHPNIVPVFDVGSTEQFLCYVVSKFIDGTNLATRVKQSRLPLSATVELVATVAETLHHAHKQGLVHRDIKPGNILLDKNGKPFVGDFGLALREQNIGKGPRFVGTPEYMSPEQARGEGHRVDGRSDIFSLGVVLYELLTGRRPFQGASQAELLEQTTTIEARPPRQIEDSIPRELERICLKSLSKRASERYTVAKDMADDLRHWLRPLSETGRPAEVGLRAADVGEHDLSPTPDLCKDSFVSYATLDKDAAFRLCQLLEEQRIGCWIAPRDVPPGADYGESIIRAIEGTKATLLLLSGHANASIHVAHEVERATSKRKRVIPVRLEDVQPSASLELHLATAQWVDAWRLSSAQLAAQLASVVRGDGSHPPTPALAADTSPLSPTTDPQPLKIVPKGLRSYDAHDADFFLELLPGPRNRDGLPESIQFWKTRIEETDSDQTFSVGLIYGPSGCGKSSLVKAGLLPRLWAGVITVYVEATPEETETRILHGLRKQLPELPDNLGLVASFAALRRREGKKTIVVLDQFEQWLHAHRAEQDTELVDALRQCDGVHLQTIIMVRDDFWLAASRFMDSVDIPIVQGQNIALVDLFDVAHAEKVLTMFGRAFGKLPDRSGSLSGDEAEFVSSVARGLAQDGKVISVRLSLFAEMVKGKPWIPATLREVGGTEGIGVNFLEETFSSRTANPRHRVHQQAARAVLKSLLPDAGTDIKGQMRSHADLLVSSGYPQRQGDFNELLRILDGELRLITPTDPEGAESDSGSNIDPSSRHYQLTHDFLVSPLRTWLTSKQQETRRGRAELRLAERAAQWKAKPENRRLPSLWEFLNIGLLTSRRNWSETERRMMAVAGRVHGVRSAIVAVLLAVVATWLIAERRQRRMARAEVLVNTLINADTAQVPNLLKLSNLEDFKSEAAALLEIKYQTSAIGSDQRLNAAVALLPAQSKVDYLLDRAFQISPQQARTVLDALLLADKDQLIARARAELAEPVPRPATDDDLDKVARWQALAAITLLRCGEADSAWPLLREGPEARVRGYIIHWAPIASGDPKIIVARLREESDVSIRRALVLMLGEFSETELPVADRKPLIEFMANLFEQDPDPGLHAAAEWLLRRWGEGPRLDAILATLRPKDAHASILTNDARRWFVNSQGQTLVVIDIGDSRMGSPEPGHRQEESPHVVHVGRRIAMAATLVTKSQYAEFQNKEKVLEPKFQDLANYSTLLDIVTSPDSPQVGMTWYEAAQYCNWLSRKEHLPECYEPNAKGEFGPGLKAADGYLQSAGYRLPTEAEWEFACRAGTVMSRYYGSSESLLPNYAWYNANEGSKTRPVANLKPNDFGLFDMLGNAFQMCDDLYRDDPTNAEDDRGSTKPVVDSENRSQRGTSYSSLARIVRSAYRNGFPPFSRTNMIGFRVARTLP